MTTTAAPADPSRTAPAVAGPQTRDGSVRRRDSGAARTVTVVLAALLFVTLQASPLESRDGYGGYSGYSARSMWWGAFHGDSWTSPGFHVWLTGIVGGLSAVAAVLVARRRPVLATTLGLWPFALAMAAFGSFVWGWWAGLLIVTCLALQGSSWRRALVPLGATLLTAWAYALTGYGAITPIGPVTAGDGGTGHLWVGGIVYTVLVLVCVAVALAARALTDAGRQQREADAATRRALEVESVTTERARLARDLHDVVAHHVSLVAVRAEAAPYRDPDLSPGARAVLADIATDARSALDELRQVLAVLGRSEAGADLRPQPGGADVATLVEQACAAGHVVTLTGDHVRVPAAQGTVLYRAVQEALTNARRHAPGSPAHVTVLARPGLVGVRVENPVPAGTPAPLPGRGLLGMRERVEALGGAMTADVDDATFRVDVTLPVPSASPAHLPGDGGAPGAGRGVGQGG